MRISDWSADVCSSDLVEAVRVGAGGLLHGEAVDGQLSPTRDVLALDLEIAQCADVGHWSSFVSCEQVGWVRSSRASGRQAASRRCRAAPRRGTPSRARGSRAPDPCGRRARTAEWGCPSACRRSEEHTSELQSLIRISYAVFCLQKKKRY